MLPDINLDNEEFNEIFKEIISKIAGYYPEWTDYNYHDPGITMIEMFSWLKEIQQYYLNQINRKSKEKFLKLLGTAQKQKKQAQVLLSIQTEENIVIPEGTTILTKDICFETVKTKIVMAKDILICFTFNKKIQMFADREILSFPGKFQMEMFQNKNPEETIFYIGFEEALPKNKNLQLYFQLYEKKKRNPIEDRNFLPLADLKYEYYSDGDWKSLIIRKDETYQFLTSGEIEFFLEGEMGICEIENIRAYFIRISVLYSEYDRMPVLEGISINKIKAFQQKTACNYQDFLFQKGNIYQKFILETIAGGKNDIYIKKNGNYKEVKLFEARKTKEGFTEFSFKWEDMEKSFPEAVRIVSYRGEYLQRMVLGYGDGLPFQKFLLKDVNILSNSFQILVEDIQQGSGFCEWVKVKDFSVSSPTDRHYRLDLEQGIVEFGDCINGMAPEGEIRIICQISSKGNSGNIKAKEIKSFEKLDSDIVKVKNEKDAFGGQDEEKLEEAFARVRQDIYKMKALITAEDYENAIMETPGLIIESCKVIEEKNTSTKKQNQIEIVVKPYSFDKKSKLKERYLKNIYAHLEKGRLIGTKILIISPEYMKLYLYIEIKVKSHYREKEKILKEMLERYFKKFETQFGEIISYSEVYGRIDKLDMVLEIKSLTFEIRGSKARRNLQGDIILPANGIISKEDIEYKITFLE